MEKKEYTTREAAAIIGVPIYTLVQLIYYSVLDTPEKRGRAYVWRKVDITEAKRRIAKTRTKVSDVKETM